MEKANEDVAQNQVENIILENIVNNVEGDIPQVMFENRFNDMFEDFKRNIKRQGFNDEHNYFEVSGTSEEIFKQNMMGSAVFQVKLNLALEKIAEKEKIEATDEEIDKELKNIADQYKMKVEDIKNVFPIDGLKKDIVNKKVVNFVKENSKITEEVVKN